MSEKMTDEELVAVWRDVQVAKIGTRNIYASHLLAHIAALAAERDSETAAHRLTAEGWWADARLWNGERDALRERVESLDASRSEFFNRAQFAKAELADECKAHMRTQAEVRALRERVQALEAENTELQRECNRTTSRLAAIRATARTLQSMSLSTVMGGEWNRQASALIREMAGDDARPSAPPEAFTHEKGLDAGVFEEAAKGCGLCPGCTDENWADGDLCDAATVRDMERTDYKAPQPNARIISYEGGQPIVLATMPPRPEPTTSEAFATVRTLVTGVPRGAEVSSVEGERLLSLLERRMGAREKAMRRVLSDCRCTKEGPTPELCVFCAALCDALTDAPAVFTLGDIQRAMSGAALLERDRLAVEVLLEQLTALRR